MLLPQKAHAAVVVRAELHAMLEGAAGLLADEAKPPPADALKALLRNLQQMTIGADEQINKAMQSCKRARSQRLETMAAVMSRKLATTSADASAERDMIDHDDDQEPDFVNSPLSQSVTRNGAPIRVEIYSDTLGRSILAIVAAENTSQVWGVPFETDQQALTEALRALDADLLAFLGRAADRPLN